ncbi:tRNA pseudouridine38-40 synthase [Enteropsectra breve]|nr:tRNA pseudouridine38-40 synthase [Enteropsectra breve]
MKRKIAMIIGYSGAKYFGLQWNNELHTIEKVLIESLMKNELLNPLNNIPTKIDMKASSRTDKGVHAAFNVINVKINTDPTPEIFARLKATLAEHSIHLYKICRVPKRFTGHRLARSRIYRYYVPTYFLEKGDFTSEYLKREAEDLKVAAEVEASSSEEAADEACSESGINDKSCKNEPETGTTEKKKKKIIMRDCKLEDISDIFGFKSKNTELFRETMMLYVGTKNYKNFTVKKAAGDHKRYMKEINVSEPFIINNVEYVRVEIHGQSFLLHQIRKMISFAVLLCKYSPNAIKENFEKAFDTEQHIPKAPSQYLYLKNILFDDFNASREEKLEASNEEIEEVEERLIHPEIFKTDNLIEWMKYFYTAQYHHGHYAIFKETQ